MVFLPVINAAKIQNKYRFCKGFPQVLDSKIEFYLFKIEFSSRMIAVNVTYS